MVSRGQGACERDARLIARGRREAEAEIASLRAEMERLQVQLAGCGVAALGGTTPDQVAKRDAYGWSPAYQDVLDLRIDYDRQRPVIEAARPFAVWWIKQPDEELRATIADDELVSEMHNAAVLALAFRALDGVTP